MAKPLRLTDGPEPYMRPFLLYVCPEQGLEQACATLDLMQDLCEHDAGNAFWEASEFKVAHWRQGVVQVGMN